MESSKKVSSFGIFQRSHVMTLLQNNTKIQTAILITDETKGHWEKESTEGRKRAPRAHIHKGIDEHTMNTKNVLVASGGE